MRRIPSPSSSRFSLVAALFCACCEQTRPGDRSSATRSSRASLRGGGGASGLFVVDADTGKPVCARAARSQRPLASNTKLFTTSTVLCASAPKRGSSPKSSPTARSTGEGVLHGNLYLQGGGDPVLASPAFYNAFMGGLGTDLYALKRQIVARAGITAVTGRLYADDTIFDRLRGVADSGYATSPYIGPLSGLSFNAGFADSGARSFSSDPAEARRREAGRGPRRGRRRDQPPGRARRRRRTERRARSPRSNRRRWTPSSTPPTSTRTTSSPRCCSSCSAPTSGPAARPRRARRSPSSSPAARAPRSTRSTAPA